MLVLLKEFPKDNSQDFVTFMGGRPGIYVPNPTPINDDFTKLPAPPTRELRHLLDSFDQTGTPFPLPFDLVWLPQKRVGELINTGGSAACSISFFFSSNNANTLQIKTPDIFKPDVCASDDTPYDLSEDFLVLEDDHVMAIVFNKRDIKFPNFEYSLYWQTLTPLGWSHAESASIDDTSNQ